MSQYVITDGSRFIFKNHQNKFVPVSNETMADVFSRKQAEGILNNSLPKPLRKVFRVEKIDRPPYDIKQVSQENLKTNTEKLEESDNIQMWITKLTNLNGLANDVVDRKKYLERQLNIVDQEILDCLHYIEFCNLNAAQGYKAYKMIKDRRIRRRSYKNELKILELILDKKIGDSLVEEINIVIRKMDNRTYEPRVLTELFDL